ncbi:MAG: hypothetical protein ROR55_03715 [Devosia sp.]
MKTFLTSAFAAAMVLFAHHAVAQSEFPDLKGTWKGMSETVVIGNPRHFVDDPNTSDPRVVSAEFSLELTGQDGRRLWGVLSTPSFSEPWLAVMRDGGETFLGVDSDGHVEGRVMDGDTIEICYAHNGETMVASCAKLSRQ